MADFVTLSICQQVTPPFDDPRPPPPFMNLSPGHLSSLSMLCVLLLSQEASAQNLPGSLGFSINGSFLNGTAESSTSILIADNDLTNGYTSGFDLTDAPTKLNPTGPSGAAAFQWGTASSSSNYPHPSALWFQPLSVSNALAETSFDLGYLNYRNGTIRSNSGASRVDLAMTLSFSQPLGLDPISVVFGSELVNTTNTSDQVASADTVSLNNLATPLKFKDAAGNRYYFELTFKVDPTTIDGTLSTQNQFHVFEGTQGSATLLGRFTVDPIGSLGTNGVIPEPTSALLGGIGLLILLRRRR